MENEIWKDVKGYEGIYKISSLGNIKSLSRIVLKNGKHPFKSKEKLMKRYFKENKYQHVTLSKNGVSKIRTVHQLVAESFLNHKPCMHRLVINHINFIKTDNRLINLEIVTHRENGNMKHIKSSSIYTGVSWHKKNKNWIANISVNGRLKYLGSFESEKEASLYYEEMLTKLGIKLYSGDLLTFEGLLKRYGDYIGYLKPFNDIKDKQFIKKDKIIKGIGEYLASNEFMNDYSKQSGNPNDNYLFGI